jgi:hypothetical protein
MRALAEESAAKARGALDRREAASFHKEKRRPSSLTVVRRATYAFRKIAIRSG